MSDESERRAGGRLRLLALPLLALLAGAAPLLLAEVALRLAGYGAIYDVYSKPSLFWQHDDLLGWAHTPGSRGTYVGPRPWPVEFETPIRINAEGLRGPELGPRESGEIRLLVLGDSMVASFEVAYEDTFVAQLGERLSQRAGRPVRTINAGVRGYGTDQSFLYYRDRARELGAEVVLFVHAANDPTNNMTLHRMRRPFGKAAFALREDGELELRGVPVPRFPLCSSWMLSGDYEPTRTDGLRNRLVCGVQLDFADHSALFSFLAMRIRRNPQLLSRLYRMGAPRDAVQSSVPEAPFLVTSALLRALNEEVRRRGARLAVLVTEPAQADALGLPALEHAGAVVQVIGHGIVEGGDPQEIRFRNDSHYNERGHRILAEFLEPMLAPLVEQAAATR